MKFLENKFRENIEPKLFGVCTYIGKKLGISSSIVRLYFIYASCISFFSPIFAYFVIAFWINIKDYVKSKINPIFG